MSVSCAMVSATCMLDKSRWKKIWPAGRCAHFSYSASAGLRTSLVLAWLLASTGSSLGTGEGAVVEAMVLLVGGRSADATAWPKVFGGTAASHAQSRDHGPWNPGMRGTSRFLLPQFRRLDWYWSRLISPQRPADVHTTQTPHAILVRRAKLTQSQVPEHGVRHRDQNTPSGFQVSPWRGLRTLVVQLPSRCRLKTIEICRSSFSARETIDDLFLSGVHLLPKQVSSP